MVAPVTPSHARVPRPIHALPLSKITESILQSKNIKSPIEGASTISNDPMDLDKVIFMRFDLHAMHETSISSVSDSMPIVGHMHVQYDASAAIKLRGRDFSLVETPSQLREMLREISTADTLAIDCEGIQLGTPTGQLCLIQLAVRRSSHSHASTSSTSGGKGPIKPESSTPPRTSSEASMHQSSSRGSTGGRGTTELSDAAGSLAGGKRPIKAQSEVSVQQPSRKSSSNSSNSKSPPLLIYIVDVHQLEVCIAVNQK